MGDLYWVKLNEDDEMPELGLALREVAQMCGAEGENEGSKRDTA